MRFTGFPPEGRRRKLSLSRDLTTSMKPTGLFAKVFTSGARKNPSSAFHESRDELEEQRPLVCGSGTSNGVCSLPS
jgi:hypothetical protein